jgi:HK97 family phage portal protein
MAGLFGALAAGAESKSSQVLDRLPEFMLWGPSKTGQTVSYMSALQVTTILACCRVLANGVSQIPWQVMKARAGGRGADPDPTHPVYKLLNRRPNFYQTSFEFRSTLVLHLALAGNAFVYISRGAGGKILELIPLEPGRVSVTRARDLSLSYQVSSEEGFSLSNLTSREIWHIRGLSWNSWMGMEAVKLAREALGLSLALEEAHARLHANGVQPSGTWSVDGKLSPEQHVKLTEWIKKHAAGDNRGAPLVLDNGAKWLTQQMSGVDSEHLATRRFQVEEDCRAMNVQPMMVFAVDKPTYASAEQLFTAHKVHTIAPLCELIEQSADVCLLGVDDDQGHYTAFNMRGLIRGSLKDQAEYYAKMTGSGGSPAIMTQDECRDELDLPPMGGKAAELREPTNVASKAPATPDTQTEDA